jgi:hypothetical protein
MDVVPTVRIDSIVMKLTSLLTLSLLTLAIGRP